MGPKILVEIDDHEMLFVHIDDVCRYRTPIMDVALVRRAVQTELWHTPEYRLAIDREIVRQVTAHYRRKQQHA